MRCWTKCGPGSVHDAQLYGGLRIGRLNGLREAFQPIDTRNENVFHSPGLQLVEHAQPELGALVGTGPQGRAHLHPVDLFQVPLALMNVAKKWHTLQGWPQALNRSEERRVREAGR